MSFYSLQGARPLGKGQQTGLNALTDPELVARLVGFKRQVASQYKALASEEVPSLPPGTLHVSKKIDGELWFLIVDGEEFVLASPKGAVVVGDLPLLVEARAALGGKLNGRTIIAGEMFAAKAASADRVRCGDLAVAMGGEASAEVQRIVFAAFELLEGGDAEAPEVSESYAERLAVLKRWFDAGKRLRAIHTETVSSQGEVARLYGEWAEGGKGEGLVVRSFDHRIYKVKPFFSFDAAIIGFTERADIPNQVRSVLLGLMREDGTFQITSSCGNFGGDEMRGQLYAALVPMQSPSTFRYASSSGELYRFVRPEMIIEVRVTDVQSEDTAGNFIPKMVLNFGSGGWTQIAPMPGATVLHPVFQRIRGDKKADPVDIRLSQLTERVPVRDLTRAVNATDRPKSEKIHREVHKKDAKGKVSVRKFLLWKTNKEAEPDYPAFVVHYTDYSPDRKTPLEREVRQAPTEAIARAILADMVTENIKKGWIKVSG